MKAKQFSLNELLPKSKNLTLRSAARTEAGWVVEAVGSDRAACPGCGVLSHSRHSCYWRQLRDLPVQGAAVTVRLQLGRWRCRSRGCEREIFTERISGVAVPHARQVCRLGEIRILVARALGGRPGQRLMNRLGMPTGRQTLLRHLTTAARGSGSDKAIRVLGVDDWAWTKGQSFGTILVDLERGVVADLLPTRSAESLTVWLKEDPEVVVVSRDRQGSYADGARRGAPQAMQVADRFHLIVNLTQAVERELAVRRQSLQLTPSRTLELPPLPLNVASISGRQAQIESCVQRREAEMARQRRQENLELFQTLHRMKAAGLTVTEIAKQLGLNRRRLDRWLRLDTLPERNRMQPRPGMVESFRELLATAVGRRLPAWADLIG